MRSVKENDEWHTRIAWAFDHINSPEGFKPDISWELATHVWESENARISGFKDEWLKIISNKEALRNHLEFDEMDDELWMTLSVLIHGLLDRDDITNLDTVISLIRHFVVMCAHSDDRDQSFQRIATSVTRVRDGAVGCCF